MQKNKDMQTMAFKVVLFCSAVAAFAASDSSLVSRQTGLMEKLDSLNASVLGLRVNGTARGGMLSSKVSSDQMDDSATTRENQGYIDANLKLTAQPSSETKVRVELRLHKDWQSAYDEDLNPVIGHWFSYDGLILNKKLAFNLGYMRVGYTPLTLYTPQTVILQEPEIFAERRIQALEERNLDTTSNRLMQGLNIDYHQGQLGVLDDIHAQATGARMRNTAKKYDQVFFDFDWSDRYMLGGRLGASAYGADAGVNYVNVFDRRKSTRSHEMTPTDTIVYEDNSVLSFQLGYDSKGRLALPVNFGATGEFAMSHWNADEDYYKTVNKTAYSLSGGRYPDENGKIDTATLYVASKTTATTELETANIGSTDGNGWYIQPFVNGDIAGATFDAKLLYLKTDKDFWSEQASSPTYWGNSSILNAGTNYSATDSTLLTSFRSGNLEDLYFSVYNTNVLQQGNLMSSATASVLSGNSESGFTYSRLYNNYKLGHFYRNGYDASTLKRYEAMSALYLMDPSVNMALPFGYATPDRNGFALNLNGGWNDFFDVNVRYAQYKEDEISNTLTQYAFGVGVDVAKIAGLGNTIKVQGSYEHNSENNYLERKTDRIVAGATVDVWGPFSLLAGYQGVTKKFGVPLAVSNFASVSKVQENLLLVGPRVKIAPASYLSLQYGLLKNSVSYIATASDGTVSSRKLDIDKNIFMGDVTVVF